MELRDTLRLPAGSVLHFFVTNLQAEREAALGEHLQTLGKGASPLCTLLAALCEGTSDHFTPRLPRLFVSRKDTSVWC